MPIYCLNSTTYASRKRSKNALIHELIGDHNYYLSNGSTCIQGHHHHHHPQHHNLSMASYNILMSRQQQQLCKSLATSSLIVTIDRFKEAVSNMKQTVLVPTMLDALAGHGGTTSAEDQLHPQHCYGSSSSVNNNGNSNSNGNGNNSNGYHYHSGQQLHTSSILEVEEEVETDSACSSDHCSSNNDSGNEGGGGGGGGNSRPKSSLSWTSSTTIPPQQPQNAQLGHDDQPMMAVATLQQSSQQQQQQQPPPLTMAASLGQHNLYEQYKLLDMIDSILSSDITYMSSRQRYQHQLLFGSASANNNNSSSNNNNPVLLNFPPESNNDDNNNCPVGSSKHHQCCLQMLKTGSGGQQMEESPGEGGGGLHGEYRSGNPPKLPTSVNGHRSALLGGKLDGLGASNGHQQEVPTSPTTMEDGDQAFVSSSSSPDSHCSLLKIKEKLEYHLVSLKSILNLLSNTADCITSSYLEGIQCEDHFDSRQLAGGAGKGNGGAGAGGGLNAGSGSELTDFQSPLSSAGNNSNSNGNSSSNSNRHYYTSN